MTLEPKAQGAAAPSPGGRPARRRRRASIALLALGAGFSALALLDPLRPAGIALGPLLALAGLLLALRSRAARGACALALAWACGAALQPEFRADAFEFFVYLPSLAFDHDLDLRDDWLEMGFDEAPPETAIGRTRNRHAIGPAVVWSPFYALAHVYTLADAAWGSARHAPDGHSMPYRRATALGTITLALLGGELLRCVLASRGPSGVAWLALAASVLASPIAYYVFCAPAMSHGVTFALAASLAWACERARLRPTTGAWLLVGALFGLLVTARWQAAVYALLVAPVMLEALWRRRLRARVALSSAALALLAFSPQMLAWRALYGRALTIPQGAGFIDWSSPHLVDTLFSADHGLFTWTPALLLGLVGLMARARREPWLHVPALLIVAATAWVNGGADDWAGSEAFGARRFDLAVPLLALGLLPALEALRRLALRRPLALPAALVAALALWNLGFVALFRAQRYHGPLRLERLAADQALQLRRAAEGVLGALFGERGRAFAYRLFAADYLDTPARPGGRIVLSRVAEADLRGRWSAPRRVAEGPAFRFAFPPRACVLVPLGEPRELEMLLTLRAARLPRHAGLSLNGAPVASLRLDFAWAKVDLTLPASAQVPGPNWLCFEVERLADDTDDEPAVAVAELTRRDPR